MLLEACMAMQWAGNNSIELRAQLIHPSSPCIPLSKVCMRNRIPKSDI